MGISHHLQKTYGQKFLRERGHFGGVSSGAATAGYLAGSAHGYLDVEQWYREHVRTVYTSAEKSPFGVWWGTSKIIWRLGARFYDICHEKGKPFLKHSYHTAVTTLPDFRSRIIDRFRRREDFGDAMCATTFIPAVTGRSFWARCGSHSRCIDGGIAHPVPVHPKKEEYPTLMLDVIGIAKYHPRSSDLHLILTQRWRKLPLRHFWTQGTPGWADEMFRKGKEDAHRHRREIDRFFQKIK